MKRTSQRLGTCLFQNQSSGKRTTMYALQDGLSQQSERKKLITSLHSTLVHRLTSTSQIFLPPPHLRSRLSPSNAPVEQKEPVTFGAPTTMECSTSPTSPSSQASRVPRPKPILGGRFGTSVEIWPPRFRLGHGENRKKRVESKRRAGLYSCFSLEEVILSLPWNENRTVEHC